MRQAAAELLVLGSRLNGGPDFQGRGLVDDLILRQPPHVHDACRPMTCGLRAAPAMLQKHLETFMHGLSQTSMPSSQPGSS